MKHFLPFCIFYLLNTNLKSSGIVDDFIQRFDFFSNKTALDAFAAMVTKDGLDQFSLSTILVRRDEKGRFFGYMQDSKALYAIVDVEFGQKAGLPELRFKMLAVANSESFDDNWRFFFQSLAPIDFNISYWRAIGIQRQADLVASKGIKERLVELGRQRSHILRTELTQLILMVCQDPFFDRAIETSMGQTFYTIGLS